MSMILIISGSPRKRGNTATIVNRLIEKLEDSIKIEVIHIKDLVLNPCNGCNSCQKKSGKVGCIHDDDFESVYEKMLASDLTIYTSPVYVWGFTSIMQKLMERQCAFVKWDVSNAPEKLLEGKKVMLLATSGGSVEDNLDLLSEAYRREADYNGMIDKGVYMVGNCTLPKAIGEKAETTADNMYHTITRLFR